MRTAGNSPAELKRPPPAIKDRQNAQGKIRKRHAGEISLFVNSANALASTQGLATVQLKDGSTFQEEDSDVQHITDRNRLYDRFRIWRSGGTATQTKLVGIKNGCGLSTRRLQQIAGRPEKCRDATEGQRAIHGAGANIFLRYLGKQTKNMTPGQDTGNDPPNAKQRGRTIDGLTSMIFRAPTLTVIFP